MITGSKQQQLTFDKGITNLPSDNLCSDNTLAEAVGMVYDNGEHHVIQNPAWDFSVSRDYKLVFVHNLPTTDKNYIFINSGTLYYRTGKTGNFTSLDITVASDFSTQQIQAIGKTLIVSTESGMRYAVWKAGGYLVFDSLEDPHVEFKLYSQRISTSGSFSGSSGQPSSEKSFEGVIGDDNMVISDMQEAYNNGVIGLYSQNKKKVAEAKRFVNPFFVRYALELFDGSYYKISQPILLLPSIHCNSWMMKYNDKFRMYTPSSILCYKYNNNYEDLSDIVKGIAVFVTRQIDVYNTDAIEQPLQVISENTLVHDGVYTMTMEGDTSFQTAYSSANTNVRTFFQCFAKNTDIEKDLVSESVFYKIFELPIKGDNLWGRSDVLIKSHTLENLTTQPQLDNDDYYSHTPISASILYTYNNRLNAAGLKRGYFDGFSFFTPFLFGEKEFRIYVRIKTDNGYKVVKKEFVSDQVLSLWFYYPDRRADWVSILDDEDRCYLDAQLKEHSGLNGAYYFAGLPSDNIAPPTSTGATLSDDDLTEGDDYEVIPNQIATSEVNNPWVFNASGYNTISGIIKAVTTQTQALSQGQFGQYPLLVFTDTGIWAMTVNSTGLFQSVHPMSREVCINPKSIIQTDGAVFFASAKGLMVINGAQVTCVSTQLSGKTNVFKDANNVELVGDLGNFADYIANAIIAYDYRDSLLWIFNNNTANPDRCYVYAIRSGTFSTFELDRQVARVVNDYPDYLLQNSEGAVYSLLDRDNINDDDEDGYSSTLISRTMKLENGLALKSIMHIKHVCSLNDNASMTFRMWASNNLKDWVELHSLRGTPWKYYRFGYEFSHLKATDTFDGSILITQERRTNKLR